MFKTIQKPVRRAYGDLPTIEEWATRNADRCTADQALAKRTVEPSEEMVEAALRAARDMFLSYAEQHQAQADAANENPSVTRAEWRRRKLKAEANRQMAAKLDAALSQLERDSHAG